MLFHAVSVESNIQSLELSVILAMTNIISREVSH